MKEYNNEAVSLGDCFLVEGGSNASGKGEQLAVVTKKTAKHVFCHKLSLRQNFKVVAKKYKLEKDRIVKKIDPFGA